MLSFAAFWAVIAATIISLDAIPRQLTQEIDIDSFLQSLQQQLEEEQTPPLRKTPKKQRLDEDEDEDEQESSFGRLRSDQLEELIKLAQEGGDETVYRESKKRKIRDEDRDDRSDDLNQEVLQQLDLIQRLQGQDKRNKKQQSRSRLRNKRNRLQINDLLNPPLIKDKNRLLQALNYEDREDDRDDDVGDLNQYSNVYVILNPEAVDKSRNKNELNELLTSLLSPSSQKKYRSGKRDKDRRYKGFRLNENNSLLQRRRGRESKEGKSMEKDYAPKRGRGRDNGGGGRTAIPYIRHRGDIYEKDN